MRKNALIAVLAVALIASIATLAVRAVSQTAEVDVRITAQRLENGRIEFGLQQREANGSWGERRLPRGRYFPANAEVNRWLNSTPVTITVNVPVIEANEEEELTPDAPDVATDSEVGKARSNPVPLGSSVRVGDVQLRIVGTTPDARDLGFDDVEVGDQYFLVHLEVTYLGNRPSDLMRVIRAGLLGSSNRLQELDWLTDQFSLRRICGDLAATLDERAELFAGGTMEGSVCYAIAAAEAEPVEHTFVAMGRDGPPVYLALGPGTQSLKCSPSRLAI